MAKALEEAPEQRSTTEEMMDNYTPLQNYLQELEESDGRKPEAAIQLHRDIRIALYPIEMCLSNSHNGSLELGVINEPCGDVSRSPYVCAVSKKNGKKTPVLEIKRNSYPGSMDETQLDVIFFGGKEICNYFAKNLGEIDNEELLLKRYGTFRTRFGVYASQYGIKRISIWKNNNGLVTEFDRFPAIAPELISKD